MADEGALTHSTLTIGSQETKRSDVCIFLAINSSKLEE